MIPSLSTDVMCGEHEYTMRLWTAGNVSDLLEQVQYPSSRSAVSNFCVLVAWNRISAKSICDEISGRNCDIDNGCKVFRLQDSSRGGVVGGFMTMCGSKRCRLYWQDYRRVIARRIVTRCHTSVTFY